jgi:hypothetical protein
VVNPEARHALRGHRVVTERKIGLVDTYVVRGYGRSQLLVLERDLDPRDHGFEWVCYRSLDMERLSLSGSRRRLPEQSGTEEQDRKQN